MIQASLFAYFALIAFAIFMVAFPDRRARARALLGQWLSALLAPFSRLLRGAVERQRDARRRALRGGAGCWRWLGAHRALALAAVLAVAAPPLVALATRGPALFDLVDHRGASDRQIARLLEGEHLTPPLALPPEVFTTREAELARPDIATASRDWNLLDPTFTQRLLVVFRLMKERYGVDMALIEGYRSPQRQEQLLAQGPQVTQAGANMSYHQHGLAADCAFFINGRIAISERDPDVMRAYRWYGELAEQAGLTWGGRWQMQDYGHVELRRPGVVGNAASFSAG